MELREGRERLGLGEQLLPYSNKVAGAGRLGPPVVTRELIPGTKSSIEARVTTMDMTGEASCIVPDTASNTVTAHHHD